jgi:RNA polymerase sigma-70 factor (ECF subfamily)
MAMAINPVMAEELATTYGAALYGFCRKLAFTRQDADDLYQQTFLRLLAMPARVDLNDNPRGFLMAIAARIWADERRKYARRERIAPIHPGWDVETVAGADTGGGQLTQQELQADVQAAVNQLADGLRVPVLLYYMGDLSIAEIASELHIPAGTVKRRLYQARQLLRQEMEANGYGEA